MLSNPVGAEIGDDTGIVTILDDDAVSVPSITISASDANASEEGPDEGVFTVSRDLTAGDLSFALAWSGTATIDEDFTVTASSGVLDTAAGTLSLSDGVASATLIITPIDDTAVEDTENAVLTVDPEVYVGDLASAMVSIVDNEEAPVLPSLTISDVSVREGKTGKTAKASVTISLSGPSADPLTVELAPLASQQPVLRITGR